MNLEVLKRSRSAPVRGDIFVAKPRGGQFLFGRVVDVEAAVGPFPAILVYLYRTRSDSERTLPSLRPADLLIPPLFTNALPWSRGYFKTVAHVHVTPFDVLPRHSFRHPLSGLYYDEKGRLLSRPFDPVGIYALKSYRTIDDAVSDALGIERAPE